MEDSLTERQLSPPLALPMVHAPNPIFLVRDPITHPGASQLLNSINLILHLESLELLISSSSLYKTYRKQHSYTMFSNPAVWPTWEEPLPSENNWTTRKHQTLRSDTTSNSREPMSRASMNCDNILYSNQKVSEDSVPWEISIPRWDLLPFLIGA